jgi:hypothetical protein
MLGNGLKLFRVGELMAYRYDPLKCGELLHIAPEKIWSHIYIYIYIYIGRGHWGLG